MSDEELEFEEAKTLGMERWVQFAFVVIAILTFYLSDKLISFVWGYFAEPEGTLVSGVAAIIGILTGFLLYRHPKVRPLADEVAGELSKVTWPTRQETWRNTIVVIITSIIAAAYLGIFDSIWSAFTDLIYSTS
ncbi:MAG: preprotein translocase subunit SecE [Sandaracinaceae bacterium]|nr:MAG: preprotein translocase subunit SecE [Sandaracinaceae bacterium]